MNWNPRAPRLRVCILLCLLMSALFATGAWGQEGKINMTSETVYNLRSQLTLGASPITLVDGVDYILQNQSSVNLRFANLATAPATTRQESYILRPGEFFGFEVDTGKNPYVWAEAGRPGASHRVVVGQK